MTALADILAARIAMGGPMTIADYMTDCLLHPEHGYYTTRDPLGTAGDFTTAPEISQMFGEILGLCLAQSWLDQGRPSPFCLAELGPGRGTLMADLLRAIRAVPDMYDAARIHLVEASPSLRDRQARALGAHEVTWHSDVADLPQAPLFLVANEFFDALPIRQFIRDGDGWRERQVGLKDGRLAFGLGPVTAYADLADRAQDTAPGDLVEICPQLRGIGGQIAQRIADHGGAALIVDYGDWRSLGDTLQAVQQHQTTDPLAAPGLADLTAHVDFEALASVALSAGLGHSQMTPQGVFLERLGITERARILARGLEGDALASHSKAHRRLTHPEEMGRLFKVIGWHPKIAPSLPGLDTYTRP